jgi:non-specific serine/threonine protein kinase
MIADELLREDIAAATDGDPKRRLGSVSELCERLRSLSQRREERAALASAAERARLDAERLVRTRARRPWVATAAAALIVGLGASLWGFHRESIARGEAEREADIATAVNRFMIDKFIATADPNTSGRSDVSVAEAVHAAIPGIDAEFANRSPEIQAALHLAMQKALSQLSDPKAAVEEARKAILAFKKTEPVDLAHLAESHIWMANDLSRTGDYRAAAAALDEAQQELPKLAHPDAILQVRLLEVRSMIAADQMDVEGGYQLTLRALKLADSSPGVPASLHDTLQFDTADSQIMLGKTKEAEATLRDLKARQEKRLGPGSPQTLNTQVLLANCLVAMHRYQEAEALIVPAIATVKATWGDKSRRTILAESVLANLRALQSRFAESAALYSSLHARMVELYGATNQTSIAFLEGAAVATQYGGHVLEAEGMLRSALGDARAVLKEDNPQVEHLRYRLAANLLEQRKEADEAGRLLDQLSIPVLNAAEQRSDWDGRLAFQQARLLIETGQPAAARPLLKKADAVARSNASPDYDLKSVPAALAALPAAATSERSAP